MGISANEERPAGILSDPRKDVARAIEQGEPDAALGVLHFHAMCLNLVEPSGPVTLAGGVQQNREP